MELPISEIVKTSPTVYPDPPLLTVAAIATPFEIVIFAVPSNPFPVNDTKETPA